MHNYRNAQLLGCKVHAVSRNEKPSQSETPTLRGGRRLCISENLTGRGGGIKEKSIDFWEQMIYNKYVILFYWR